MTIILRRWVIPSSLYFFYLLKLCIIIYYNREYSIFKGGENYMIQSIFKEIDAHMGLWFVPQFNLLFNDADGIIEIASIINLRVIGTIDRKKC